MKGYYQKRIHQLETELERRQREIAKEHKAREEAERYIYELLRHMGGHALIWTRNLGRQNGKMVCNVDQRRGIVRMKIVYDERKENQRCLKNSGNLTVLKR